MSPILYIYIYAQTRDFITLTVKLLLLLPSSLLLLLEAGRALSTWQGCHFLSIISEECEIFDKDTLKLYSCSSASSQILEDSVSEMEQISFMSSSSNTSGNNQMPVVDGNFRSVNALESCSAAHFSLLLKNLDALDETCANSDVLKLEKKILLQLGRLGALQLFDAF
ncbi:hypothetical protein ACFX2C_015644 [Malus domestica]